MTKTYELPNGRGMIAEFDDNGISKITEQALDSLIRDLNYYAEQTDVLDKIRAEIESMDFDFGDYYDHTNEIIEMVCKTIDKYKGDKE